VSEVLRLTIEKVQFSWVIFTRQILDHLLAEPKRFVLKVCRSGDS
jgi:hypothetical protein